MIRLICSKCKKASYTVAVESFNACGYCGFVFSGKYGSERRVEKRIKYEMSLIFSYQGQDIKARTMDFSDKGLGIKIFREAPMKTGDILGFSIGDHQIKAKVMWVTSHSDISLAGFRSLKLYKKAKGS